MVLKPRPLRPGDIVALVSPASPIEEGKLQAGRALLEGAGYGLRLMPNALAKRDYLAGDDAERAADLTAAFADPEIKAVWCSRGGYGSARLLPHLDLDAIALSRKLLLGFSDITSLHIALNRRGLPSVHAPMALTFNATRPEWVYESFMGAIAGSPTIPQAAPLATTLVPGVAEGQITGGCLCLLTDSLGTPDPLETRDRLLLIEDVDENPHRIDAMLNHLKLSGCLNAASGFIVGEMTGTDSREDATIGKRAWLDIVTEYLAPLGKPAVVDFPFGHVGAMASVPLGIRGRLDADAGRLTILEDLCSDD